MNSTKPKKKSNRCTVCNKKTGIMPFTCKCSSINLFCSKHRLPEYHNCTYDWFKEGKEKIIKENPLITTAKLIKINDK
tara:strand:- start:193 stop:426 length:234 start_codon:yes stop_codon:yes gene_type:complete